MANELKRSKRIIFDNKYEKDINRESMKLLDKYKANMFSKGLAEGTIYGYTRDLIQWLSYIEFKQFGLTISEADEDDIEEFIFYCREQGNNIGRIKRRISSISNFYDFLRKKRLVKENPCDFIDRPKKGLPVVVQTFFTKEQYAEMKNKLRENGDLQLETYAVLSTDTMGRVNAMSNITWDQIDIDQMVIDDVLEKEGKIVTLYFTNHSRELLIELKKYRSENKIDDNGYLFIAKNKGGYNKVSSNTLRAWANKVGKMIGIETLHPHDFRHSGSNIRKSQGMDINDISALLNHGSIDVTKNFYLREDKKAIGEIVRKYEI